MLRPLQVTLHASSALRVSSSSTAFLGSPWPVALLRVTHPFAGSRRPCVWRPWSASGSALTSSLPSGPSTNAALSLLRAASRTVSSSTPCPARLSPSAPRPLPDSRCHAEPRSLAGLSAGHSLGAKPFPIPEEWQLRLVCFCTNHICHVQQLGHRQSGTLPPPLLLCSIPTQDRRSAPGAQPQGLELSWL